jgi:Domain of unknown function (DUF4926)
MFAMSRMPGGERAIVDIRKLEHYCLNALHARGRHKARVFLRVLGLDASSASWFREALLDAARTGEGTKAAVDEFGSRWQIDLTLTRSGRTAVVRSMDPPNWRGRPSVRHCLDALMGEREHERARRPSLLDPVALLSERPEDGLSPGQVGTVVEVLDAATFLVEFSDDDGRAYALTPCSASQLLVLRYVPEAA